MCRWMAYKGVSIYLEDWLLNSDHSLIEQSRSADLTKYTVNGDGFGIGWYGNKPEPGLFKSVRPAWNNSNLQSLAAHVASPLFLAHIRAATGTPIQETNSHPFQYNNWLLVHNGLIKNFKLLKKALMETIDEKYFQQILGSTDSEIIFYMLLTNGLDQDVSLAVNKTVDIIEAKAEKLQIKNVLNMTLGISNGDSIWAVRYSTAQKSSTLFYSCAEVEKGCHLLVVSEPLEHGTLDWQTIEENSILHFDENNQKTVTTIK